MTTTTLDILIRATDAASGVISKVQSNTAKLGSSLQATGRKVSSVGRTLTTHLTLPLIGVGVAGVKTAVEFDKTMNTMKAVAGVPGPALERLRDLAVDLGAKTVFSANEAAEGMLELGKAGISTSDIMGGALANTLDLATAGDLDLASAATIASNAMHVFGLSGRQSQQAVDALAGAANASSADVDELAQALAQGGLAAANAGLSVQETTATLAAFADAGLRGSDAGTSLKTFMLSLVPTSAKAKEAVHQLGLEFVDQQGQIRSIGDIADELQTKLGGLTQAQQQTALKTIFGTDAFRAATVVMKEGADGLARYEEATGKVGTASDVAAGKMKGLPGAIEQLRGSLETAGLAIGEALTPIVKDAAKWLTDLANRFADLPDSTKKLIVGAGAAVAALGPLLWIVGKTASALRLLGAPISLAARGIGGLATGVSNFVLDLRTGAGGIAGFRTALSSAIGPMGAFAIAATAIVAAGVAINNFLKKDDEAAAGWVEKINAGTTSLTDLKAAVDQVTGDKTLTDKFNGDQTVLDAYGKTVQQLSAQYLQMGADVHLSTTSQLAFSQAMLGSSQITKKQADKIVNLMGAYEKLKGPLDDTTLAAIKNLLAVGDEGDAYKLLQRLIEGALGPLRNMPRPTTLAAEAAADHAVKLQAEAAGLRAVSRAANEGLGPLRNWASAASAAAEAAADLAVQRSFGGGTNTPRIPHLAEGGIVTRPTLALIGEAGPEAVVPLGDSGGFSAPLPLGRIGPDGPSRIDVRIDRRRWVDESDFEVNYRGY